MTFLQALAAFGSFDHGTCDDDIRTHHLWFFGLLNGGRRGNVDLGLELNFLFAGMALVFGVGVTLAAYVPALKLNREVAGTTPGPLSGLGRTGSQRWIGPLIIIIGASLFAAFSAEELVRYVTACRAMQYIQ